MGVLRDNKESLMAVLEAFIYDPLMNWRLTQRSPDMRRTGVFPQRMICFVTTDIYVDSDPKHMADLARVAAYPQGPTRKLKADESHIFNGR
jgi:FKBP12-rapamycin complex-associated protein